MKSFITALIPALLISGSVMAQQDIPASKVPAQVRKTIESKYPGAKDIDWEQHGDNYEAEIEQKGMRDMHLLVDASGNIIGEKQEMKARQLPASITKYVTEKHSGYHIDDVHRIVRNGKTFYQLELEANLKNDIYLVFSENGTLQNMDYWH